MVVVPPWATDVVAESLVTLDVGGSVEVVACDTAADDDVDVEEAWESREAGSTALIAR